MYQPLFFQPDVLADVIRKRERKVEQFEKEKGKEIKKEKKNLEKDRNHV